jgi:hypothetical protein
MPTYVPTNAPGWNPAAPPSPGEWAWNVQTGPTGYQDANGGRQSDQRWMSWWGGRDPYTGDAASPVDARLYPRAVRDAKGNVVWAGDIDQSYRWFEPDTKEFYEDNPTQAYQGFLDWGFGDRERPLAQYARGYYSRAYADALAGQEGAEGVAAGQTTPPSGGAHWVDYLTPELVYTIRQSFNMQSASNRGVVNQYMPAGRMT